MLLLFQCPICKMAVDHRSFPLCRVCLGSLVLAPELCSLCASPLCIRAGQCRRPWAPTAGDGDSEITRPPNSYTARYILVKPGYTVLKSWKVSRGPALDRQILRWDDRFLTHLRRNEFAVVVAVPQQANRAWLLRGSPAEVIARSLAVRTGRRYVPALRPPDEVPGQARQAELPMDERLAKKIYFSIDIIYKNQLRGQSVLLVDDFMTSGHTLRRAAMSLRDAGAREVHVFCLGVRPFRWDAGKLSVAS